MAKRAPATTGRGVVWLRLVLWAALVGVVVHAVNKFKSLDTAGPDPDAVGRARRAEIAAVFAARQNAWTRQELEAYLGQPIRIYSRTWDDPRRAGDAPLPRDFGDVSEQRDGVTVAMRFTFLDGRWANWSLFATAPRRWPPAVPVDPFVQGWLDARLTAVRAAFGLWLVLMIAAVLARRTRAAAGLVHAAMLAALLGGAAAEALPGESWMLPSATTQYYVGFALSLIAVSLVALTLVARRARRVRRDLIAAHVCLACGYDCRATPGSCPECGTPAPAA